MTSRSIQPKPEGVATDIAYAEWAGRKQTELWLEGCMPWKPLIPPPGPSQTLSGFKPAWPMLLLDLTQKCFSDSASSLNPHFFCGSWPSLEILSLYYDRDEIRMILLQSDSINPEKNSCDSVVQQVPCWICVRVLGAVLCNEFRRQHSPCSVHLCRSVRDQPGCGASDLPVHGEGKWTLHFSFWQLSNCAWRSTSSCETRSSAKTVPSTLGLNSSSCPGDWALFVGYFQSL